MVENIKDSWLRETTRRRIFRSSHFFIKGRRSICGRYTLNLTDEKDMESVKFSDLFKSKTCKTCINMCEAEGIDYRS